MPDISTIADLAAIVAGATGTVLLVIALINPGIAIVKHYITPKLRVIYAYPGNEALWPDEIVKRTDDKLVVKPGKPIKYEVSVKSQYFEYSPSVVEFVSIDDFEIDEGYLFTDHKRWWEEPYPGPDIHGNFKRHTPGLIIKPKGISGEGTLLGFKIEPRLEPGETREILFRMEVEESRKLLTKSFYIEATEEETAPS